LCEQKGSLVDDSKTRFDFSWSQGLSVAQIEQIENTVNAHIEQRLNVFTEVVPLSQATSVNSVRKVFGETYPDPVRVVSVGRSVAELLADPHGEQNLQFAIEFCGGTHLSNTSEAEGFVILEESGIAKGIRRIVGVTRSEAAKARQTAKLLESKVNELEALPGSAELVARHKVVKTEVEQSIVSVVVKDALRTRLTRIYENTIKAYLKAAEAAKLTAAMTGADVLIAQAVAESQQVVIANLDFNADGKVAKKIFDKLRAAIPDGSFVLVSSDEDGEKIGVYTSVSSKHQSSGISAKRWVDFVMENLGSGRGGGKADMANAMIPLTTGQDLKEVIDRTLTAARTFWQANGQK
jgi:alanyl-tRNA synthetase